MYPYNNSVIRVPDPYNEPILEYAPGSSEREKLQKTVLKLQKSHVEIPLVIGGEEIETGDLGFIVEPHDHQNKLGTYHKAGENEVRIAVENALASQEMWQSFPWEERCAIFLKAAELLAVKYRYKINGGAILAGGKNVYQAEIDAACELIDFLRFNVYFAKQLYENQPVSSPGVWNSMQYRPLEGFVLAITPFNFTAIAGNLPTAPALMGNSVVWKPASTLVYTPYMIMEILQEAGLPPGVINFIPGSGEDVARICLNDSNLAGVHFTGSTTVFKSIFQRVGKNISNYKSYPRLVGETGGKDFVFAHASCHVDSLVTALVRGSFEYQGQKCSAASRAYIPRSIWPVVKKGLQQSISEITIGPPTDFNNFFGSVIDQQSYDRVVSYIEYVKKSTEAEVIIGGSCDDSTGWFIDPTVIVANDPFFKTMVEEVFGPVLTVYLYAEDEFEATLELCDKSLYGLTGAIFSTDRKAIQMALSELVHAAGNFYINDKPTGAVVGQQPFGGARGSGTNDKAGSMANLTRWVSPRTVKELFVPPTDFKYPFMG